MVQWTNFTQGLHCKDDELISKFCSRCWL